MIYSEIICIYSEDRQSSADNSKLISTPKKEDKGGDLWGVPQPDINCHSWGPGGKLKLHRVQFFGNAQSHCNRYKRSRCSLRMFKYAYGISNEGIFHIILVYQMLEDKKDKTFSRYILKNILKCFWGKMFFPSDDVDCVPYSMGWRSD